MAWRNIFLLVLSLVVIGIKSDCDFQDKCNAEDANIAHYTCAKGAADTSCVCEVTGEGDCPNSNVTDATTGNMDGAKCKAICVGTETCEFYKYNKDEFMLGGTKHCYLMDKDQCTDESEHPCKPDHCMSGGINCDGTNDPKNKCLLDDNFGYDDTGMSLHWSCITFSDGNNANVNVDIYADGTTDVPTGTICTATHKCYKYPYPATDKPEDLPEGSDYTLQFKCDDNAGGSAGEWKSLRSTDSVKDDLGEAAALNEGKLIEPNCSP